MKKFNIYILSALFLFISIISLQGCKDDTVVGPPTPPVTSSLIRVDSLSVAGAKAYLALYIEDSLHVGYNRFYAVLYDSVTGALITDAHVLPNPHNHTSGAPFEAAPEDAVDGKFPFAVIFTTPSALRDVLHWGLTIGVHNHGAVGEPYGEAVFSDLDIAEYPGKFQTMLIPDGGTLYMSYINPKAPTVGLNNFEFLINKSFDNSSFIVDTSYAVTVKPVLLSTGDASTGNTDPLPSGEFGHYSGRVNMPTSGTWRIKIYMTKGSFSDSTYFDKTF